MCFERFALIPTCSTLSGMLVDVQTSLACFGANNSFLGCLRLRRIEPNRSRVPLIFSVKRLALLCFRVLVVFFIQDDNDGTDEGLGFLRLHSTYRHDLKIYASDEGKNFKYHQSQGSPGIFNLGQKF